MNITCCLNCPPTDAAASTDVPPGDIKNAPPWLPPFGGGGDLSWPPLMRVGEVGDGSGGVVNSSRTRGLSEERKRLVASFGRVSCVCVCVCVCGKDGDEEG